MVDRNACTIEGCDAESEKAGFCIKHYWQQRRGKRLVCKDGTVLNPDGEPETKALKDGIPGDGDAKDGKDAGDGGAPVAGGADGDGQEGAEETAAEATLRKIKEALGADQPDADTKTKLEALEQQFKKIQEAVKFKPNPIPGEAPIPELHHKLLPLLRDLVRLRQKVLMVGPAGSGKTTAAAQVADALELPFYMSGAVAQKYELLGFVGPDGTYYESPLYKAYTEGGVFLWDEIDASHPSALVAFNATVENKQADFPNGLAQRHENFLPIAAANTFGLGGSFEYVGRNQLDAATLDRYLTLVWDYDIALESMIAGVSVPAEEKVTPVNYLVKRSTKEEEKQAAADELFKDILRWRKAVSDLGIRHMISPRATIAASAMLKGCEGVSGIRRAYVESLAVWKGLDKGEVRRVKAWGQD